MYFSSIARNLGNIRTIHILDKNSFLNYRNVKKCHIRHYMKCLQQAHGRKRTVSNLRNFDPKFHQTIRQFSLSTSSKIWVPWRTETPLTPPDNTPALIETAVPPAPVEAIPTSEVSSAFADPGLMDLVTGAIVDPPFIEMGLATHWYPNHFVHQLLEFVHLSTDLPWWSTIIVGTVVIRVLTMPMYIATRKYTINQANHSEEVMKLTAEVEKWKYKENQMRMMVAQKKLKDFYKETGTSPIRGIFANTGMTALFITCAMALRQMVAVPVPSFAEGGTLWFTDLSASDPYYILPTIIGGVIGLSINTALQTGTLQPSAAGVLRKVQYLPIVLMPLVFGSASCGLSLYWLTTSVFSLIFQRLLLLSGVKKALKFPVPKARDPTAPSKKWSDWKEESYRKTERRMQHNEIKRARKQRQKDLKKALKGDPPITYEIGVDATPTKQEMPDFEREWRPPKPKQFGYF